MLRLALRQLQLDPVRTVLTAVALGAVIAVILILGGFEQGQYYQLKRMALKRNGDLVLTQAGVRNFIAVRSSIPQTARSDVEAMEGIKYAYPITALSIIHNVDNVLTPVYILLYDTGGGPSTIIEGSAAGDSRGIVVDYSLANKYGIRPGDEFIFTSRWYVRIPINI